jgi:hypothetical protein
MELKQIRDLGNFVGFTVAVDPKGVIVLLRKYNISVPSNPSNKDLISAIFNNGLKNASFSKEFGDLTVQSATIVKNISSGKLNSNFTEGDTIVDDIYASANGYSNAGGKTDWGGLAGSIVGAGAGIFGSIQQTKAQQKLAESQAQISANETAAAIANANTQLEIEKLRLQQAKLGSAAPVKSNTMMYVGIGIAVVLAIGVTIVIVKK